MGQKTIGYARRSRESDNGSYSLDDQEEKIRKWAEYKGKGHDLAEMIREDDVSGTTPPDERPLLGPALAEMRKGDCLVVAKLDRLSRSLFDFAGLIKRSQTEGWALVCLDPELDLTTASGRVLAQVVAAFAEFERAQLVERLQGARRAKGRAGGYIGGARLHRRYGYRLTETPSGKSEYEPIPSEQAAITEMRTQRAKGATFASIAKALEDQSIPGPTGKGWSQPTVLRILNRDA